MFNGLRTAIYHVDDIDRAKQWYSDLLGIKPYFDQPFYVGFNVGGYELGLHPDDSSAGEGNSVVVYWGVDDAHAAFKWALERGAEEVEDPRDVGEGILVASVRDPFGNIFGIIQNPHFTLE